jgi:uncharacterized membrane protein
MSEEQKEQKALTVEILEKVSGLATAGLGLVAALAWNDAIKSFFDLVFPEASSVAAQFTYAAIITVIVVIVTVRLGRLTDFAKRQLDREKKKIKEIADDEEQQQ